jgi:ATP-dependent Lhr-like helicase
MVDECLKIKRELWRVWSAFFSAYSKLLPIQIRTVPKVLSGRNLILTSPAATGKTEAICAPIAQRLLDEEWKPLSVLYISPTRALVNDLYRRLKGPLEAVGIDVGVKTQDRPQFNPQRPTPFLLTTPESFDSLLARHPRVFESLRVVCLDEIHLFDNTPRGDALRVMLERVRLISKNRMSFYALSATIHNPYLVAERYFDDFDIIRVHDPRKIDSRLIPFCDDPTSLIEDLRRRRLRKVIIFCNTRQEVEGFALRLRKSWSYRDYVFTHHASLTKREREMVEKTMNSGKVGMVVSTMTLELGIDIGDIDCIVFCSPPPTCSSMLQRLGRGNRRSDKVVAYGLYRDGFERVIFEVMFWLVGRGWIEEEVYYPRISVAPQQILSYLYQKRRRGATISSFARILRPLGLNTEEIRRIVVHLLDKDYISIEGELLFPGDRLEWMAKRGLIHSNIESLKEGYEVIDVGRGEVIGRIEAISPSFLLKGKVWGVKSLEGQKVFVEERGRLKRERKVFHGRGMGFWDWRFGEKLKRSLFHGVEEDEIPWRIEDGRLYIYHLFGSVYGHIMAETLCRKGHMAHDLGGVCLVCEDTVLEDVRRITIQELKETLKEVYKGISKFLNLGSFFRLLPDEMRLSSIEGVVDLERLHNLIARSRYRPIPQGEPTLFTSQ